MCVSVRGTETRDREGGVRCASENTDKGCVCVHTYTMYLRMLLLLRVLYCPLLLTRRRTPGLCLLNKKQEGEVRGSTERCYVVRCSNTF